MLYNDNADDPNGPAAEVFVQTAEGGKIYRFFKVTYLLVCSHH